MRAVVQRTRSSQVKIDDEIIAAIGPGLTVLLGVRQGDGEKDADYLIDKIVNLRIFEDDQGKMNRSLVDIGGALLLVSQFTLYADARKGRRPGFSDAEEPQRARSLVEYAVKCARDCGLQVETGQFGANMLVLIENQGPVTILLDSERII